MSPDAERSLEQWLEEVKAEYWNRLASGAGGEGAIGVPHVLFRLAGHTFAVEASLCKGVVRRTRVARLPGVPPHVLGVAGIRGEVLSATDPAVLLGLPGERGDGRGYFLILASEGLRSALWVDWVDDVVLLDEARLLRGEAPWPLAPEGVMLGEWQGRDPGVRVVDGRQYLRVSAVRPGADRA
ncbi:MAG: chemotaxis protein CheW [Deltaproteobacteria bacterium]|nr:chemotaxis protein CheW [Deltaproteobacteria bacterium]